MMMAEAKPAGSLVSGHRSTSNGTSWINTILVGAAVISVYAALDAFLLSCRCMSGIIMGSSLQLLAHELSLLEAQPPLQ
jgi:hypothetical protein